MLSNDHWMKLLHHRRNTMPTHVSMDISFIAGAWRGDRGAGGHAGAGSGRAAVPRRRLHQRPGAARPPGDALQHGFARPTMS